MAQVEYVDGEPNGLATIVGGLIEANLIAHPERERLLKRAAIGIIADDAGVAVSLRFSPGRVTVASGFVGGGADLIIRTTSEDLIAMSSVPLRFGLPDVFTAAGREVTGNLLSGRLKVAGLFRHLPALSRLQRLLSVA